MAAKSRTTIAAIALGCLAGAAILAIGLIALEWSALEQDSARLRERDTSWHDPNTRFDAELGWAPIPSRAVDFDWGEIRSNSHGFRSEELRDDAEQLVVLGDSVAWGFGVSGERIFSALLDRALHPDGMQVSNLAVSGYGVGQDLLWLERQRETLPRLRHAILALCANNDIADTASNARYGRRKPLFRYEDGELRLVGTPIARNNLLHWYTDSRFLRSALGRAPGFERWLLARIGHVRLDVQESDAVLDALLVRLRDEVAARGGQLHVLMLPSQRDLPTRSEDYERLRQAAFAASVPVVEVDERLQLAGRDPSQLFLDATHLRPRGHAIVARALLEHLARYDPAIARTRSRFQAATAPSS